MKEDTKEASASFIFFSFFVVVRMRSKKTQPDGCPVTRLVFSELECTWDQTPCMHHVNIMN